MGDTAFLQEERQRKKEEQQAKEEAAQVSHMFPGWYGGMI